MERRSKKIIFVFLFLFCIFNLNAQTPSIVQKIRFPIWAEIDAYPGLEINQDDNQTEYSYAISRIKDVVPFLLEGMIFGWEFTYTPYDKTRKVDEFFEIKPISHSDEYINQIEYSSVWVEEGRFNCWVDYARTEYQIKLYNLWAEIQNPVIQGKGYGSLEKGFEGIKEAVENSCKEAIRAHYNKILKNKPKEIKGKILIRRLPILGIDSGRYIINLDFFLEYGKIKEYKSF